MRTSVSLALALLCVPAAPLLAQEGPPQGQQPSATDGAAEQIARLLAETKITRGFADTPLGLAIKVLAEDARLNVVLAPEVDPEGLRVTLTARDLPLGQALAAIEDELKLAHTVWCGVLYLHPKGEAPPPPVFPAGSEEMVRRTAVSFERTPFLEALGHVRARTQLDVRVTARARARATTEGTRVTLKVRDLEQRQVLQLLAQLGGFNWLVREGRVVFEAPEDGSAREITARTIRLREDTLDPEQLAVREEASTLVAMLKDPVHRDAARLALRRRGEEAATAVLVLLGDAEASPEALRAALEVVGAVGGDAQAAPVLKLFQDANRSLDLRTEAGNTLGAMGAVSAIPALLDALEDPWFKVSETARAALVRLGEPAVAPLRARIQAELTRSTGKDGMLFRGLLILGSIGSEESKKVLLEALGSRGGPRERAMAVRHHAAIGIGLTGDYEMVDPLIEALGREDEFLVAKYIARSLGWITGQELPPQAPRWRRWWDDHRGEFEPEKEPSYEDGLLLEMPKVEWPDELPEGFKDRDEDRDEQGGQAGGQQR